jgi:hypothetical protein
MSNFVLSSKIVRLVAAAGVTMALLAGCSTPGEESAYTVLDCNTERGARDTDRDTLRRGKCSTYRP